MDYGWFTLLFGVQALLAFATFIFEGKSFVWYGQEADGLAQHYTALVYEGMWLRSIAKSILAGHPTIPLWDYSIGYGADVLTTMSYYSLGDPVNLLSALVPSRYTEYLFDALIILRLWLAGVFFTMYCHKRGHAGMGVSVAALSYVFCGFMLRAAVRHPMFINPLIYLPLLLIGIERIYQQKRPALYTAAIFLSAFSNYYFFYMLAMAVAVYAIVRYFTYRRHFGIISFVSYGAVFVGCALVGVACAAVILLPTVGQLVESNRANVTMLHEPWYKLTYYTGFLASFFKATSETSDRWRTLGFSGPALLGVVCLFAQPKKHRGLLVALGILTALFLSPAVGSFMNGFSYVANRWSFIYAFMICYILALEWNDLIEGAARLTRGLVVSAFVVGALLLITLGYGGDKYSFASFSLYLLAIILLVQKGTVPDDNQLALSAQRRTYAFVALIVAGITLNAYSLFSARGLGYVRQYVSRGMAYSAIVDTPFASIRDLNNAKETPDALVRVDTDSFEAMLPESDEKRLMYNTNIFATLSSTQYYWSLADSCVSSYLLDLELPNMLSQNVRNLNKRALPLALAGVSYEVIEENPPYGFSTQVGEGIWAADAPLALGYGYTAIMPMSEYQQLDAVKRQQAQMQAAVLEDDDYQVLASSYAHAQPTYSDVDVSQSTSLEGPITQVDESTFVAAAESQIVVTFEGMPNCETYLCVEGVDVEPMSRWELINSQDNPLSAEEYPEYQSLSTLGRHDLLYNDLMFTRWDNYQWWFSVPYSEGSTGFLHRSTYGFWSDGAKNYVVNLGYHEAAQTRAAIKIPADGRYTFKSVRVICQPMDDVASQVAHLGETAFREVNLDTNTFEGTISLADSRVVTIAVPHAKGWRAVVDGQPARLLTVGGIYMGLALGPGEHTVELHYTTHLLKEGLMVSAVGFVLFAGIVVLSQRWQPERSTEEEDVALSPQI